MTHFFVSEHAHLYSHVWQLSAPKFTNAHPVHMDRCMHIVNISWLEQQGWNSFKGCHGGPGNPALISMLWQRARAGRTSIALYKRRDERESVKSQAWWGDEAVRVCMCVCGRRYANEGLQNKGSRMEKGKRVCQTKNETEKWENGQNTIGGRHRDSPKWQRARNKPWHLQND